MAKLFRRLRYLLRQGGMERELAREIEHHRELTRLRLEREGRPAQGAVDRGARILGNVSLAREDARAVWLAPWLEGTWQDLQYAMRSARREPAFATLVMLTLGITIGLNASVFTAFNGILVRPWPVRDPGSVVTIADAATGSDFSLVESRYLAEHARSFSGLHRHALHRRYQRGMRDRSRGGARQSPARHRKLLRCARRRHRAWPWTARQRRPPGCTRSGRRHQLRCLASALRSGSRDRRPSHSPGRDPLHRRRCRCRHIHWNRRRSEGHLGADVRRRPAPAGQCRRPRAIRQPEAFRDRAGRSINARRPPRAGAGRDGVAEQAIPFAVVTRGSPASFSWTRRSSTTPSSGREPFPCSSCCSWASCSS